MQMSAICMLFSCGGIFLVIFCISLSLLLGTIKDFREGKPEEKLGKYKEYKTGYDKGYDEGYDEGHKKGYSDGTEKGFKVWKNLSNEKLS